MRCREFGDYQDAMLDGTQRFLYHAVISPYLNIGLLDPLEVCRAVPRRPGGPAMCRSTPPRGSSGRSLAGANIVRGIYFLEGRDYRIAAMR